MQAFHLTQTAIQESDEIYLLFTFRMDPVQHAKQYPMPEVKISGSPCKLVIAKENNFTQPGERYRSWEPARQDRFVQRAADTLLHPRVTQELRQ